MLEDSYNKVLMNQYLLENFNLHQANFDPSIILESGLSRIYHHITNNVPFAIVSVFTRDAGRKENLLKHEALKKEVRNLGYGFIEQYGGYTYQIDGSEQFAHEKSLFIPKMPREVALQLGAKYDQDAIIYKDENEFAALYTKDGGTINDLGNILKHQKGDVETAFEKDKGLSFDPYVVYNIAYSALVKNNSKSTGEGKPKGDVEKGAPVGRYAFHLKEDANIEYVIEIVPPTLTQSLGRKNTIKNLRII